MAGLQRSTTSFRRQGSSGLIWDDKFLSGDLNQMKSREDKEKVDDRELRPSQSAGSIGSMQRIRSDDLGHAYKAVKALPPRADPPSPKVSGCGFCGIFGKPVAAQKPKANKSKS